MLVNGLVAVVVAVSSMVMGMPLLRSPSISNRVMAKTLTLISPPFHRIHSSSLSTSPHTPRINLKPRLSATFTAQPSPIADAGEALMGFITGKRKATEVVHSVWKNVIRKGDTVIDATCGNGHDTLALLKLMAGGSGAGYVYGMDMQSSALECTSSLLDNSVDINERKLVKLFSLCHSKMEDIIPKDAPIRLIAFNLGYLPGGDKAITTTSQTTSMALQAASRLLMPVGLISLVVYVGHPGGRDELESVQSFASSLPVDIWVTCKFEVLNRPTAPVLVFLFKK